MSAASFWKNAKAAYWAARKQDVHNIYDTATNMGNVRSSYNRAATVIGPQRVAIEAGLREDWQTYKRKKAYEAEAARRRAEAEKQKAAYNKLLSEEPQKPLYQSYVFPATFGPGQYITGSGEATYMPTTSEQQKQWRNEGLAGYQAALDQYGKDHQIWLEELYKWRLTH